MKIALLFFLTFITGWVLVSKPAFQLRFVNSEKEDTGIMGFETGDFKGWNTNRLLHSYSGQVVRVVQFKSKNGMTQEVPIQKGKYAARFEIRPGDFTHDGFRAEIKENYNAIQGSVQRYFLSTLIPEDYPSEDGNQCLLAQWHDEPNPTAREPAFANYYINGDLVVAVKSLQDKILFPNAQAYEAAFNRANQGIDNSDIVGRVPQIKKAMWHNFIYEVKWAADASGYLKGWIDGRQFVDYSGPIGYADEVLWPYFKFGVYCENDVTSPHVIFADSYRRVRVR